MTTKNIFIANMALSDMVLCLFTIPLTVLDLIHTFWPILVSTSITCQLLGSSQSVSLFFSSYAILLIAIDRLLHIVYPYKPQINSTQVNNIGFTWQNHFCLSRLTSYLRCLLFLLLLFPYLFSSTQNLKCLATNQDFVTRLSSHLQTVFRCSIHYFS